MVRVASLYWAAIHDAALAVSTGEVNEVDLELPRGMAAQLIIASLFAVSGMTPNTEPGGFEIGVCLDPSPAAPASDSDIGLNTSVVCNWSLASGFTTSGQSDVFGQDKDLEKLGIYVVRNISVLAYNIGAAAAGSYGVRIGFRLLDMRDIDVISILARQGV